jgi:hypothetical protein
MLFCITSTICAPLLAVHHQLNHFPAGCAEGKERIYLITPLVLIYERGFLLNKDERDYQIDSDLLDHPAAIDTLQATENDTRPSTISIRRKRPWPNTR